MAQWPWVGAQENLSDWQSPEWRQGEEGMVMKWRRKPQETSLQRLTACAREGTKQEEKTSKIWLSKGNSIITIIYKTTFH